MLCAGACMRAKSLQSCLTLCDPLDCSPPGSSVHGDSPGKNTDVGCHDLLQGIFLTQGSNLSLLRLLHWQAGSLPLMPPAKPLCVESGRKKKVRQITWKAVQHWGYFLECKCHSWANSLSFHDISVSWTSSCKESDTTEQFSLSLFLHFHCIEYSGTVSLFQALGVQKQVWNQPWDSWCDCASQASLVAQMVKNLPIMRENQVQSLGQKDALEKGAAAHSRIPAQRIPWIEEPGEL